MDEPDLDAWLPEPSVRVAHRLPCAASPERAWEAAQRVRLADTRLLGRLLRWRIPGLPAELAFDDLFRQPPFIPLAAGERSLLSGLVGRIWTLRRDYPRLEAPDEFRDWSRPGTVRVVFANWVTVAPSPKGAPDPGASVLHSEVRVQAFGVQGRLGLSSVRPLIRGFNGLIATEALTAAARSAEAS